MFFKQNGFTCLLGLVISWLLLIELNKASGCHLPLYKNKGSSVCSCPSPISPCVAGLVFHIYICERHVLKKKKWRGGAFFFWIHPKKNQLEYLTIIILDGVNNKRMASEISTHQLNLEKFIIPGLKFTLRALVICGLFNITKIFTKKIYIIYLIPLVFSNSKLL